MDRKPPFRKPTETELAEAARQTRVESYRRQIPLAGRVAALNMLHDQLVDDAKLYASDNLQDKRDAVAHALIVVTDYLISQGFAHRTVSPLMRPVAALAERENNSLDLMFAQRARPGRPKATLADHERTGILAALAEGWLRTHPDDDRPQSRKLASAAREMKGRWFGTVTRAQLETARELVSQEASDHPAVVSARSFNKRFETAVSMFGENAFPLMLRMLNDTKLAMGGGEPAISKTPDVS